MAVIVKRLPARPIDRPPAAWPAFAACLIGVFMQMIDVTIVNTALPDISRELAASSTAQLLVLGGYSTGFACTLLTAARVGGMWGRRRAFLAAVAAFTAASVWCGLADGPTELVIARVAQGVSAAVMSAQTVAIVAALFPRARHRVVYACYGATAALAGMAGPLLGGLLVDANVFGWGWHTVFLMNVPLGVAAFALAARYLPVGGERVAVGLDGVGAALSTAGLFALTLSLAAARGAGRPPRLWALLVVGIVLMALFLAQQRRLARRGGNPLVRLDIAADRGFTVGGLLMFGFYGVFTAFLFAVSITAQDVLAMSAWHTALLMLPFAMGAIAGTLVSPILLRHWGKYALTAGVGIFGCGLGAAAAAVAAAGMTVRLPDLVAQVCAAGFGMGLFAAPLTSEMVAGLATEDIDAVSGLVPTVQQIGSSVGLAALTALFFRDYSLSACVTVLIATMALSLALAALTIALPTRHPR